MKKLFFILFAMAFCLSAEPVGIEDAWQMVQERNDGIKAKKQGVKHAQKIQDSATSMYLPQLTLNGSYTHLDKPIGVDIPLSKLPLPLPDYQLDLSKQDVFLADVAMLWPVFTGGQITAAQEIREAQVKEGRAHFDLEEDKTFVQLITYYYGVVMGKAYYETRLEVQKALELHFDHAKKLLAQGQIAKVELLNAQVKLDAAKIETRQALYRYDIVRSALSMIVKEKEIIPASPLFINDIDEDESYFIAQTLVYHPAMNLLDAKETQSEKMGDVQSGKLWPTLFAYGNYNLYKDDSALMELVPDWFIGAGIKFNLLDRDGTREKAQAAKMLHQQVIYMKEQAKEELSILAETLYKEMLQSREEYLSLSSSLQLAEENVRLRIIAFSEGLSTSLELVDAELFLASVKTKRLNASYTYVKKLSELIAMTGDTDRFFVMVKEGEEVKR